MLSLLDTTTGQVVPLAPRDPGKLSVYLCGPTVSGPPHLGHGRVTLVWDIMRRYLTWSGLDVQYVSNVTDIEDKILARAAEEGVSPQEVSRLYEDLWFKVMEALGVQAPTSVPHATAYVPQMVELVERLVERGYAYVGGDGVYFSTEAVAGYGLLAHQDVDSLRAGARVATAGETGKRSPLDFVLWKLAKPGEPSWPSPWGDGRPGWHTECVVMSLDILGEGFDLHIGGLDLAFPHHENERAQALAAGYDFAHHWAHHGMVVDERGEKMSKSVGNISSLPELLEHYDARALRLLVLQAHYRSPMVVSTKALDQVSAALERLDNFARHAAGFAAVPPDPFTLERFRRCMEDDLDTPGALAVVFGAVRDAWADGERAPALAAAVLECCQAALGLVLRGKVDDLDEEVARLVHQRDDARARRDWAAADDLRAKLAQRGFSVEDSPEGTRVHRD